MLLVARVRKEKGRIINLHILILLKQLYKTRTLDDRLINWHTQMIDNVKQTQSKIWKQRKKFKSHNCMDLKHLRLWTQMLWSHNPRVLFHVSSPALIHGDAFNKVTCFQVLIFIITKGLFPANLSTSAWPFVIKSLTSPIHFDLSIMNQWLIQMPCLYSNICSFFFLHIGPENNKLYFFLSSPITFFIAAILLTKKSL